jgi:hypothetical protein
MKKQGQRHPSPLILSVYTPSFKMQFYSFTFNLHVCSNKINSMKYIVMLFIDAHPNLQNIRKKVESVKSYLDTNTEQSMKGKTVTEIHVLSYTKQVKKYFKM